MHPKRCVARPRRTLASGFLYPLFLVFSTGLLIGAASARLSEVVTELVPGEAVEAALADPPIMAIHTIVPSLLGAGGGVPLTIFGYGFPASSVAALLALHVTVAGHRCTLDEMQSTSTRLVCSRLPRLSSGRLPLVDADVAVIVTFGSSVAASSVRVSAGATPLLERVSGSTSNGGLLAFTTNIVTRDTRRLSASVSDTTRCSFEEVYGLAGESIPEEQGRQRSCRLQGVTAGFYNASIVVSSNIMSAITSGGSDDASAIASPQLGAAISPDDAVVKVFQLNDDGGAFTTQVFPRVDAVAPSLVSVAGGAELTITGSGFRGDAAAVKVLVGTEVCTVVAASFSRLRCLLPPGLPPQAFVGGIGVVRRTFGNIAPANIVTRERFALSDAVVAMTPNSTEVVAVQLEEVSFQGHPVPMGVTLDGLFVPNISAPYTFYCSASDFVEFRLAALPINDSSEAMPMMPHKELPLLCSAEMSRRERGREFVSNDGRAVSVPVALEAGRAYQLHVGYGAGSEQSWYRVAMSHKVPIASGTASQRWSTVPHTIVVTPEVSLSGDFRTQTFTIELNRTQVRVPGVDRTATCGSLSLADIINRQFAGAHALQAVAELAACQYFITFLQPVGHVDFRVLGARTTHILNGSMDWFYDRVPTRLMHLHTSSSNAHQHDGVGRVVTVRSDTIAAVGEPQFISFSPVVPLLYAMGPYDVFDEALLTFWGRNLTVATPISVHFEAGGARGSRALRYACEGVSLSNSSTTDDGDGDFERITCRVPSSMPGGIYTVAVSLGGLATVRELVSLEDFRPNETMGGFARPGGVRDMFVRVNVTLTTINPAQGSMYGGTVVTLAGRKLPPPHNSIAFEINFGGAACEVLTFSTSRIVCRTAPLVPLTNSTPAEWVGSATSNFIRWNTNAIRLHTLNLPESLQFLQSSRVDAPSSLGFAYLFSGLPVINGITPHSGPASIPVTFQISGRHLAGAGFLFCAGRACTRCHVLAPATMVDGNASCVVDSLSPGTYSVLAQGSSDDTSGFSPPNVSYVALFDVVAIEPKVGSIRGGTSLTLHGFGFHASMRIRVGAVGCALRPESVTYTVVECVTEPWREAGSFNVVVDVPLGPVAECLPGVCVFSRNTSAAAARVPRVTGVLPRQGQMERVTLSGAHFPPSIAPQTVEIVIGGTRCDVQSAELLDAALGSARVVCLLTRHIPAGEREIVVVAHPFGVVEADRAELLRFDATLAVQAASPLRGSCGGGHLVTITGLGFSTEATVEIGAGFPCRFGSLFMGTSVNGTRIICETAKRPVRERVIAPVTVRSGGLLAHCCSYTYEPDLPFTPTVRSITPLVADPGRNITVDCELPLEANPLLGLFVLQTRFALSRLDRFLEQAAFIVPAVFPGFRAAGSLRFMHGNGWVSRPQTFVLYPTITRVTALGASVSLMSMAGGEAVNIEGSFFTAEETPSNLRVTVCGNPCEVVQATPTHIDCIAPPLVNREAASVHAVMSRAQRFAATPLVEVVTANALRLTDNNVSSVYIAVRAAAATFFVGIDIGSQTFAMLSQLELVAAASFEDRLRGAVVELSNDGVNWEAVATLRRVAPGWNSVTLRPSAHYARYVRLRVADGVNEVRIAELAVEGVVAGNSGLSCLVVAHLQPHGSEPITTCDERPLLCASVDESMRLDYSLTEYTPTITRMFPRAGPSAGGTRLTLLGRGFNTPLFDVSGRQPWAEIDGVPCPIVYNTTTEIHCVTGRRGQPNRDRYLSTKLWIPSKGFAQLSATTASPYAYEDPWSALATWGAGGAPRAGAIVVVPEGVTVSLDISPPPLTALIVRGGLLVMGNIDLELIASYIIIDGGWLRVGAIDAPFSNRFTITLTGNADSVQLPRIGAKVLAVHSGRLELFGTTTGFHQLPLALTALPGDTFVTLASEVNWAAGEEVILSTTTGDYEQTELRTIFPNASNPHVLHLDRPLKFPHFATVEHRGSGAPAHDVTFGARVVRVTRNIRIRGDAASASTGIGCHVFVSASGKQPSFVSLTAVQIRHCGQAGTPNRHPLMLHSEQTGVSARLQRVVVLESFNRGIVLHDTNRAHVDECVVYDTAGHGIALSGGASRFNQLRANLVYLSRPSPAVDPITANIYVSHPQNWLDRNVAGGASHMGFWLNFADAPENSNIAAVCPNQAQLQHFYGQVAHSNGMHGLWVYPEHLPRHRECGPSDIAQNPVAESAIQAFSSFLNRGQGANLHIVGGYVFAAARLPMIVEPVPCKFYDNGDAGIGINHIVAGATVDITGSFFLANSVTIAPEHFVAMRPESGVFGVRAPGSDGLRIRNVTFEGYSAARVDANGRSVRHFALLTCAECGTPAFAEVGGFVITIGAARYVDSHNRVLIGAPFVDTVVDLDGTTVERSDGGALNYTILPRFGHIASLPSCIVQENNSSAMFKVDDDTGLPVMVCNRSYAFHRFVIFGVEPRSADFAITTRSPFGEQLWNYSTSARQPWLSGYTIIIPSGSLVWQHSLVPINSLNITTAVASASDVSWTRMGVTFSREVAFQTDSEPHLDFRCVYEALYYRMDVYTRGVRRAGSRVDATELVPLGASASVIPTMYAPPNNFSIPGNPTRAFVVTQNRTLVIRFTPQRAFPGERNSVLQVNAMLCSQRGCIFMLPPVAPVRYGWLDPRAWPMGVVPGDGADVVIPPGMTILLSTATARLRSLVIQGTLELHPRLDAHIRTNFLVVYGGALLAGTVEEAHIPRLLISLITDNRVAPMGLDDDLVIDPGTFLSCGHVSLVGQPRTPWTPLGSVAERGRNELRTQEPINWQPGDHVAVTSGSYSMDEMEEVLVAERFTDNRGFHARSNLLHEHIAYTLDVTDEEKLELNAKAALLSRTVTIEGVAANGTASNGCALIFTELGSDVSFASRGVVQNAEIRFCGFAESGVPALLLRRLRRNALTLQSCAVHHSLSSAMGVRQSSNVIVTGNVFYVSYGSTLVVEDGSNFNTFRDNLAFGTHFPTWMTSVENRTRPYALCSYDSRFALNSWIGNVAAGSASEGFCVAAPPCFSESETSGIGDGVGGSNLEIDRNEAHSNIIGWFTAHATPDPRTGVTPSCVQIKGQHAWHNSYIGIHSAVNADTRVSNSKSHDNHISYHLSREGSGVAVLDKSIIGGRAAVFDNKPCEYFRCVANPFDKSCPARAELYDDESRTFLFGEIGVVLPVFMQVARQANYSRGPADIPLIDARVFDKPARSSALHINNPIFYAFQFGRDFGKCSGSTAISTNGMTVLPVAPTLIANATTRSVVVDAKVHIHDPSDQWLNNPRMCGAQLCDALNHVMVLDLDGRFSYEESTIGDDDVPTPGAYVSNNRNGALTGCEYENRWNVFVCPQVAYGELFMESLDVDAEVRIIEPLQLQDQDFLARINTHAQPPECNTDDCDGLPQTYQRHGRFNSVLQTESTYLVDIAGGEEPRRTRWTLRNCPPRTDPEQHAPHAVLLRISFPSPVMELSVWEVSSGSDHDNDGRPIPPSEGQIEYSDRPGANYFEETDSRLYVLVPCGSIIDVHQIVSATIGLRLHMPIERFAGEPHDRFVADFSTWLGVERSRVRIADVYPGSTIVAVRLFARDSAGYNSTREADEVNELIMRILSAGIARLASDLRLPVVDIDFIEWAVGTPSTIDPGTVHVGLSAGIIATIVVLSTVVFVGLVVLQWRIFKAILKYKDFDDQLAKEQQVDFPELQHPQLHLDLAQEVGRPRVEVGLRSLKINSHDEQRTEKQDGLIDFSHAMSDSDHGTSGIGEDNHELGPSPLDPPPRGAAKEADNGNSDAFGGGGPIGGIAGSLRRDRGYAPKRASIAAMVESESSDLDNDFK